MPSLGHLPIELVQKIASSFDYKDLLNFSLTSKAFFEFTQYECMKRVKAKWATDKGVFFRICETGAVRAAAELVTEAKADPNIGFAATDLMAFQLESSQPNTYPRLDDNVELRPAVDFCLDNGADTTSLVLVKFDGRRDSLTTPDHLCATQMLFPLHVATAFGQVKMVEFLLCNGAYPDPPCSSASIRRNIQEIDGPVYFKRFTDLGPEYERAEHLITPLYLAVNGNQPEVADLLIRSGASLNLYYGESRLLTPFHVAVGVKGIEMAKFLIKRGLYSLNEVDYAGLPPIWIAYLNNNWETVHLLIGLGANINHDIALGFTPLVHALCTRDYEAVKKLMVMGADKHIPVLEAPQEFPRHLCSLTDTPLEPFALWINFTFGMPSMSPAYGDPTQPCDFLSWLVAKQDIDLDTTRPDGMPLSTKLFERYRATPSGFLSQGLDHNILHALRQPNTWRPMVLERFLELGADPMASDSCGNTLLDLCLMATDFRSYRVLRKYTQHARDHFAQHCSVDGIMDNFAWTAVRSATDVDGKVWELFVTACLETLMALGLTTEAEITNHPDFSRLLCKSIKNGKPTYLSTFLISLKPPAAQLMTPCDEKTP